MSVCYGIYSILQESVAYYGQIWVLLMKAQLTALNLRCEGLAQLPILQTLSLIYERLNIKRDTIVQGNDHWLVNPFKTILDVMVFPIPRCAMFWGLL